jgi:hypothetical protein
MHTSHAARRLLWVLVLGHFAVTLVHGAVHAAAAVPMSLAANVFIVLVIEIGPLAGLMMLRSSPAAGAWVVAATLGGALVFGLVNHFVIAGADHVTHIADRWRDLFAATAVLLGITEIAGTAAGIFYGLTLHRTSS